MKLNSLTLRGWVVLAAVVVLLGVLVAPWPSAVTDRVGEPTATLSAQGYSNTNPYQYWVPPGACSNAVVGTGTANTFITSGAGNMPVIQAASVGESAQTYRHTYVCNISPPNAIITTGTGIAIQSATFMYGVQTGALGAQVATLGSGMLNSSQPVFSLVTYPTPGTGETPSTVAPVRADTGTFAIVPGVATFNTATATAGSYYSVMFTPSTPIAWKTASRQLLLTVQLIATTATALTTNSPGVLVRWASQ